MHAQVKDFCKTLSTQPKGLVMESTFMPWVYDIKSVLESLGGKLLVII